MTVSQQIDNRIKELNDWRGPVFAKLRKLIHEADPTITEEWKWDTGVWSHDGMVCALAGFKDSVGLNFFQGASLQDTSKLFNAGLEAKKTRMVKFFENDPIDENAVKDLIKEAVQFNINKK